MDSATLSAKSANCSLKAELNQINGSKTAKKVSSYDCKRVCGNIKNQKKQSFDG